VRAHPEAYAAHLGAAQEVLERAYRSAGRHLALFDGDAVRGVLPLVVRKGPLSGHRLRSLPGYTAGPLAGDLEGAAALLRAAREVAEREGAALAVTSRLTGVDPEAAGVARFQGAPAWILRLDREPEDLRASWRRSSNVARSLRKAEAAGLTVRPARSDAELRAFHTMYVRTMRAHAAIPRSLGQLRLERELLGDQIARLFLVRHAGRVVAGGYYHAFNGRMLLVYNASRPDALALRPNHALYWHTIRWAWEHGLREYDLGFAWPATSLGRFKAQWGAAGVQELLYTYPPVDQTVGEVPGGGHVAVRRLIERVPSAVYGRAGAAAYRWL
jgi:hypothetical protein